MDEIENLLPFQNVHVKNLVRIIKENVTVLDASDTGTGKTYCALAACSILKLNPIIICPKSVLATWKRVSKIFNVNPVFIVNYETLRIEKYYDDNRDRVLCPYIKMIKKDKKAKRSTFFPSSTLPSYSYEFSVPDNSIFIFDEAHRCSNLHTQNGQLLFGAKLSNTPIMVLSATIADKVEKFHLFFWILNFIDPQFVQTNKLSFAQYMLTVSKWVLRDHNPMLRIHNLLYPNRASRMRIDSLGNLFPETQITAEPYSMGKKREIEIEEQYSIIAEELENLKQKKSKDKQNPLVNILRAHQKIELLKIPTFVEIANDFLENGYSVVIFVNFTQTLETLANLLHTTSIIYGQQTAEQRDKIIDEFTENKSKIIIANIKAGGVGISLHDIYGNHPRASIISPTWSSIELVQALGRIHRAGAKTKSLQRIIYAANTVEEKIAEKLKSKLNNINEINNGDLDISKLSNAVVFKKQGEDGKKI